MKKTGEEVLPVAKKVLLHYGGRSAVESGLIDRVKESLARAGVQYVELGGVQPNPRLSLVEKGIETVHREGLEAVPCGRQGGSVIDSSKAIAAGAMYEGGVWDFFFSGKARVEKALPVVTVLHDTGGRQRGVQFVRYH